MKEIIITEEIKKELENNKNDLLSKINKLEIKSETENINASDLLKNIKSMKSKVEDTFNPLVKAAKRSYDEARGLRDTYLGPLETAERQLRAKISAFLTAETQRREEIQKKANEKFQKAVEKSEKTGKPLSVAPIIIDTKIKTAEGSHYQERWSAEVLDISLLPKEYILPNMTLLNKVAQSLKSNFNIPGAKATKTIIPIIKKGEE